MKRSDMRTVVCVDDEPDIREVVELSLGLADGLTILTRDCGESALRAMRELKPDLVLLDVMMPGMDGPATLQRMREEPALAHIPVVFLTAKTLPQEVARLLAIGAVGTIAKPFDPMSLAEQLYTIWERLDHEHD